MDSGPLPAVLVEEAGRAASESKHVAPALARRAAAVVDDAHAGNVYAARDSVQPHAPVEILEVQKESRIEPAGGIDGLATNQHEAAADHRNRADPGLSTRGVDHVAHFIALEPASEHPAQPRRGKPAQREVEHAGVALAKKLARAVG